MKFKIIAEVTIEEDSPLMPVTCDKEEKSRKNQRFNVAKKILFVQS